MTVQFIREFSKFFKLVFYGVDIIICKETGKHYVIDCNYLPNYSKCDEKELIF